MTLLLAGSPAAFAQAPTPSEVTQQTNAIVKPSVVFIQTMWSGYLTNATFEGHNINEALTGGQSGVAPEITATTLCSGFVVSPAGSVVTAGHCVDDKTVAYGGKGVIINKAISELRVPAELAQEMRAYAYQHWTVEGKEAGSEPERSIKVFPTLGKPGIDSSAGVTGTVKGDVVPFNKGDVALLKIDAPKPLPALDIATGSKPDSGTPVLAAGYPGTTTNIVDLEKLEPTLTNGKVTGNQSVDGYSFTGIDASTSQGMSGGPVTDAEGRVLGVVSWSPGAESQPFNFITDTSTIRDVLHSAGVTPGLSETDKAYRAGLANYFAGKYRAAVTEFDKVLAVQPNNAVAERYKSEATSKFHLESTGSNTLLFVLIGVGVLMLAAATTALLLLRRRRGGATGTLRPAEDQVTGAQSPRVEAVTDGHTTPERTGHFCPQCGVAHDPGARFCASCGYRFPAHATHGEEGSG